MKTIKPFTAVILIFTLIFVSGCKKVDGSENSDVESVIEEIIYIDETETSGEAVSSEAVISNDDGSKSVNSKTISSKSVNSKSVNSKAVNSKTAGSKASNTVGNNTES